MPNGYNGKVLRIDLTSGNREVEQPDELFYRRYWGGKGLAGYYLLKEQSPGTDPLGPDNLLIFAAGVMTGSNLPAMPRYSVAARSPLTGGYGEAEAGGWWGPELKFAGYDAVVIKGRADHPVYLWIHDGDVEIRDARDLWGMDTGEAQDAIRRDLGDQRVRVAGIGPGGEKLVRYACILNEGKHANGRNGMGAVMGSKRLKAIAVRGTNPPRPFDPGAVHELARWYAGEYLNNPTTKVLYEAGTPGLLGGLQASGILPTRNFRFGTFEGADSIGWDAFKGEIFIGAKGCFACPIRCKREARVEGKYATDSRYGGPEYETLGSFGSNCGVNDLRAIAKANEMCNRYGLDTISTGVTISFAMECYENGLLTQSDTDGIDLRFGNAEGVLAMVGKIARREGIGDLLADGSARAAQKIGRGAERFAIQVKGQELPMHEPRGKPGVGLGYGISDIGADHLLAVHDAGLQMKESAILKTMAPFGVLEPIDALDLGPRKVRAFLYAENIFAFWKAAGVCNFGYAPRVSIPFEKFIAMARAVTGWDTDLFEISKVGERVTNMSHAFNLREGIRRKDDRLPDRFFEPLPDGRLKGTALSREQYEEAITLLYEMKGWDPATGIPSRGKLAELDLDWLAELLRAADVPIA
jgi:aldehyde:ferredoxin oxidoreductase